jgi:hypothetical protein
MMARPDDKFQCNEKHEWYVIVIFYVMICYILRNIVTLE